MLNNNMNNEAANTTARIAQTHSGWRNQGCAVLPIGKVNLTTAANKDFGTMWTVWTEGEGTNLLCEQDGKFKAVHTSGTMDTMQVGDTLVLKHDQTFRTYGAWKIVAKAPHNAAGLLELKKVCNTSSINFATFK
jgi:hypothetical protein